MAGTRLYDIANALLDDLVTRMQTQGVTPPDRRYVHPGPATTVDRSCPQMTIASDFVHRGPPGAEDPTPISPPCVLQRTFQMTVEIVRCVPTTTVQGRAPAPDAWSLSALEILTDGWALSKATFGAILAGTVVADEGCDLVAMGRLTTFGPEGGIGGVQQVIQAQV